MEAQAHRRKAAESTDRKFACGRNIMAWDAWKSSYESEMSHGPLEWTIKVA